MIRISLPTLTILLVVSKTGLGQPVDKGINQDHFECGFNDEEFAVNNGFQLFSAVDPDSAYKWAGGVVPYFYHGRVSNDDKRAIRGVMDMIEDKTCAKFKYSEDRSKHHLAITVVDDAPSCIDGFYGSVGNEGRNVEMEFQKQLADIEQCEHSQSILHEFMHAFGVMHTHKRRDRNETISVNMRNIVEDPRTRYQYEICDYCEIYDNIPYECDSVMHYGEMKFHRINKEIPIMKPHPGKSDCNLALAGIRATENDWKLLNLILHPQCTSDPHCINDDSTANTLGDTCSNSRYDEFPEKCGDFDTAGFTASLQCCSCGGGSTGPNDVCVNDDSTMNSLGDTCSNSRYDEFPEKCGYFDTAPFTASVQCCSCGGGSTL